MMDLVLLLITAIVISVAVFDDVRFGLIPNYLTFTAMATAIVYHGYLSGGRGVLFSIVGLLAGSSIFLLFYVLGGMGAGDVKLMMVIGSLLGPRDALLTVLYTGIAGGVYSIILLARSGFIRKSFLGKLQKDNSNKPMGEPLTLRYGIAIGAGTLIVLAERVLFRKSGVCLDFLGSARM